MFYSETFDDVIYGLRPVDGGDLDKLAAHRNDLTTWRNLTQSFPVWRHNQRGWLESLGKTDFYFMTVVSTKDPEQIYINAEGPFYDRFDTGLIRVTDVDWQNRNAAVGVDTFRDLRGKGYGTKFFNLAVKWCFEELNMHRVWLMVLDDNTIAAQIYKRAGFRNEGVLRQHIYRNGKYHDYKLMGLTVDEWRV